MIAGRGRGDEEAEYAVNATPQMDRRPKPPHVVRRNRTSMANDAVSSRNDHDIDGLGAQCGARGLDAPHGSNVLPARVHDARRPKQPAELPPAGQQPLCPLPR